MNSANMKSAKTNPVTIYSKQICPYCTRAKSLLNKKGITYTEHMLDNKPDEYAKLKDRTGHMTVPQIFVGDHFIGGYSELSELNDTGELDKLLYNQNTN